MNYPPTFVPSDLENIDFSVFEFVDRTLDLKIETNEGSKKIPVIFATPERSWSSKAIKDSRQDQVTLKYPLISITRKNITKPDNKSATLQGTAYSANPYLQSIPVYTELNHEKTSDRSNADSKRYAGTLNAKKIKTKRKIYNIYSIPFPTFIEVEYSVSMISNYQAQMNIMLQPFIKYSRNINGFKISRQGHGYECFIDETISESTNLDNLDEDERKIEYSFNLKVRGYLHVGDINDKSPTVIRTENQPELTVKGILLKDSPIPTESKTKSPTRFDAEGRTSIVQRTFTQLEIEAMIDARIALLYGLGPISDGGDN